jgi:hypothetical protein
MTIVMRLIFSGLVLSSLSLNRSATVLLGTANIEIRADDGGELLPVVDVVDLSRELPAVDPSSNVTTALCCKAMYGNVDPRGLVGCL